MCRLARIVSDGVYVKAGDEPVPDWLLRRKLSPMRGEVVLATRMLMANLDGEVQHG